jgi:hypothetical protein
MKWFKILIWIGIIYGIYGHQQLYFSTIKQENKNINEIKRVQLFLQKYNSPLQASAKDFIEAAKTYKIDYKVLVGIAGVESGFCKHPAPGTAYNCWGFRSYSSPSGWWRFASYREGIFKVAKTLGTDRTYQAFQRSGKISELACPYNNCSEDWTQSIEYFISKI